MLDTPVILETTPQLIACVHVTVARDQIQHVMGPAISEVYGAIMAQQRTPTGPWFTHHHRIDAAEFEFDACVPVDQPITPVGRVFASEWPATRVVKVVYSGPYEGLGEAWPKFKQWLASEGHVGRGDLYERYLVGPESTEDPNAYRTELIPPPV